jgi:uncharacterized protein (DUF302 family)
MKSTLQSGIVVQKSNHSVDVTVQKLRDLMETRGIKLFALVDHSGEAEQVGLHMNPTKLLIFGNPKAGTPIMVATPTAAIDLPLKILVSADNAGVVWIYYNSSEYLHRRNGFPETLVGSLAVVETLAESAGE